MKAQTAALGFRVKSGWAAAVLLSGPASSPRLSNVRRIDLSDPRLPETRQPYHAAMGKLETDTTQIERRTRVVRRVAQQSITKLLASYRQEGHTVRRAILVIGSEILPDSIANPHIRAHALEGQLFRSVLQHALEGHRITTDFIIERDAYAHAAAQLKQSSDAVKGAIQNLGRSAPAVAVTWRAEQKFAAIAAWLALC